MDVCLGKKGPNVYLDKRDQIDVRLKVTKKSLFDFFETFLESIVDHN